MGARGRRALGAMLYTLVGVLPVVLAANWVGPGTGEDSLLVAALLLVAVLLTWLFRRGHDRAALTGLVAALVVCAALFGIAHGSMRSTGLLALVAAIVVGGLFLGRMALVLTVAAGAVIVGGLVVAENLGWLRAPNHAVGVANWVIYVAVLAGIALNIAFARGLAVDATQRARDGEAWLAAVLRGAPGALIISSLDEGRVVEVNAAYERIFGLSRERAAGRTVTELGLWAEPADRDAFVARLLEAGRIESEPVRLRRADGEVFDALLSGELLDFGHERCIVASVADVSAELGARRALQASEARFRRLFEASPVATTLFTPDEGRLVDCNAAYVRLLGRERDALIGRRGRDIGLWKDFTQRERAWEVLQRDGMAVDQPADLVHADGRILHCRFSWTFIDVDGRNLVLAQVTDDTDRQNAEAALRASELRFQTLFSSNPAALVVQERSSRQLLLVNAAAERIFRVAAREVVGVESGQRFWGDTAQWAAFWEEVDREGRGGPAHVQMRRYDGEVFDALISAELTPQAGVTQALIAIVDISEEMRVRAEQRASEERLARAEAQLLEVAKGVAAETGEAFFRKLVEQLALATGADRVLVGEVVDGGTRVRTVARLVDGAQAPGCVYDVPGSPCEVVLQQGRLRHWASGVAEQFPRDPPLAQAGMQGYIGAPLIGVDGRPAGIMNVLSSRPLQDLPRLEAVFRIFSARAEAELVRLQREREIAALNAHLEQRVRERTAQLEATNDELEAFAYSASHDLRAPLNGIQGFTSLLLLKHAEHLPAEARGYLEHVRNSTQRMARLIEDLLALSRVSRGELVPKPVDLTMLAHGVAAELARTDPQRRVNWQIADGLRAWADPGLVHIALVNLLGNAWKYTRKVPDATICLEQGARDGDLVEFRVRDNGAGFDMAQAEQLFQPFRRLHSQSEFEGTGVGLATVRRVVERHGGRVRGEGQVGVGATICFSLPAAAAH
ncbi:MAG: PAS domain S-box protein [Rubrivivax sp.]|nr:PAS domain S-box protein [Rubrivivax sp.]